MKNIEARERMFLALRENGYLYEDARDLARKAFPPMTETRPRIVREANNEYRFVNGSLQTRRDACEEWREYATGPVRAMLDLISNGTTYTVEVDD